LPIADFNSIEDGSAAGSRVSRMRRRISDGSGAFIIEHGGDRFAVIITGMGTRNAEAKADAALVSCPAEFPLWCRFAAGCARRKRSR
jgi:hypothetical protein